jgi:hypothetical protein
MRENGPYNADAHHHNYYFGAEYEKHLALSHQLWPPQELIGIGLEIEAGNIGTSIKAEACHGGTPRRKILKLTMGDIL